MAHFCFNVCSLVASKWIIPNSKLSLTCGGDIACTSLRLKHKAGRKGTKLRAIPKRNEVLSGMAFPCRITQSLGLETKICFLISTAERRGASPRRTRIQVSHFEASNPTPGLAHPGSIWQSLFLYRSLKICDDRLLQAALAFVRRGLEGDVAPT